MSADTKTRFGLAISILFFSFDWLCSLIGSEHVCATQHNNLSFVTGAFMVLKFSHQEYLKIKVEKLQTAVHEEGQEIALIEVENETGAV